MKIILENKYGKITLGGEGFNILSVEGLGLLTKSYTTVKYVNKGGQQTINVQHNSRVITIGGDVYTRDNDNMEKALKILSDDVWLTVFSGTKKRKIYTKIKEFTVYNKNGGYSGFTLQLEADSPYFNDLAQDVNTIYGRKNLITGEFTLPCVFTERTNGKTVVNKGGLKTYPKIVLYDIGFNGKYETEKTITLVNETTGKSVTFDYETTSGEVITVDFDKRTIESNYAGDILNVLALENYLSEFCLEEGENFINIINNTSREISPVCFHDNNYNECI